MKALVLTEKEKITLNEIAKPEISPEEVLVKVSYCGICGTDVHIFHGEPGSAEVTPPIILGHEFSGEIIEVGSEVDNLAIGDHVAVDPNIYCGKCRYCREGRVQLCENLSAVGVTRNGGMEEFCNVPAAACLKIAHSLSLASAAMVEPLSCVLHGFNQIRPIKATTKTLIVGGGFIGSLFLQALKYKGATQVDICELNSAKHPLLKELGANQTYTDLIAIKESYDLVIECAGKKVTSEKAVTLAGKGGEILLFGVPSPDTIIELPAFDIFSKELTITGSFINPFTLNEAVSLLESGDIKVDALLSHEVSLAEVPELLANFPRLGITKAIIKL
ncbi:zinc-dependent alcohol dehydrogenase family protein [Vagococcus elongatus]|uniref:Theronine dehydrogenase n=1 Tax=Vagococcus elongatus TaxID=180344 RepID=A0A430B593_9ENTE|nr:zinc-dependent alcohol dehydrogenase family protein [Vagococcus elongatus]RSU15504.1 theronine dehydrogenase [Vagococcus elongatus]